MGNPDRIQKLLQKGLDEFVFSAYQFHSFGSGKTIELAGGVTNYWDPKPVSTSTLFDIASLTKVVSTTTLVARRVSEKKWSLEDSVGTFLDRLKQTSYSKMEIGELLSHCAGLLWWEKIHDQIQGADLLGWFEKNEKTAVERPRRKSTVYSDLDFLMLGLILEKEAPLEHLFEKEISGPLGMKSTAYGPVVSEEVVATEVRENKPLQGRVFDDNTHALNGVSAHAGLFSNVGDLSVFCKAWLDSVKGRSKFIEKEVAEVFTKKAGLVPKSTWAYGWDMKSPEFSSCGSKFSASSFGHLGFTGTSIWIDPKAEGFAILLTNRVHPSRLDERIKRIRPKLHDEVYKTWKA